MNHKEIQNHLAQSSHRAHATVQREATNEAARTVDIAWASEQPVQRAFGWEVLDCAPNAVRMNRLNDGAAVLFNHDPNRLIGVVEQVQIGADRICRARVRFDTCDEAEMRFQQVRNGVLRHVSVGYRVHACELQGDNAGESTYRMTDWEPHELSFCAIPAHPSVGIGRSADVPTTPPSISSHLYPEIRTLMNENTTTPTANTNPQLNLDTLRRDAILDLGRQYPHVFPITDVQTACRDGHPVDQVQKLVLERIAAKHTDTRGAHIGMSAKEINDYSIAEAVRAMLTGDWSKAGGERYASDSAAAKFNAGTRGLLVPFDVMAKRDFTAGTASEAGNLISTSLRGDLFSDVLRNRLALGRLGATMLFGLTNNIDMPRKVAGSAVGFVNEVAALAETAPSTGKVTLSPMRIGGYIEFSKQAVIQSALAVEPMLRQDIFNEYQVQFESAAINGSGTGAAPRGLRSTNGIGAVTGGTNGAPLSWSHVVGLESACANVNAEPDAGAGYLVNTRTRGWAKTVQKAPNLPFLWDNGAQPLNGYRAEVTNTVPSNLSKGSAVTTCSSVIFGSNWPMFVMGSFGAVEILVDETSLAINGMNRLILNAFIDCACRRAADFAVMEDALTQ